MDKALALALLMLAIVGASIGSAATTYTPTWGKRLYDANNNPVETADAVDADNNYVYILSTVERSKARNVTVTVMNPSDGSAVNVVDLYASNINLTGWDLVARDSPYIYLGITYVDSSGAVGGYLIALDKSTLDIAYSAAVSASGEDRTVYGVCRDASGNIYATGLLYNPSTHKGNMSIIKASPDLQTVDVYYVSWVNYGYNSTGLRCTYGYDGYVYFVGQLFYGGFDFPAYVVVLKLNPSDMSIAAQKYIGLWNSQSYVVSANKYDVDISANTTALALAFGKTDDLPDPANPSSGASVMILDHSLNQLVWRNISTSYNEELDAVAMSRDGSIIAGGQTVNDYGTGLGTSYYKSLVLIMTPTTSLSKAILYGASDADSEVSDAAIAPDGSLYLTSNHYSDTITYYDITSDITVENAPATTAPGNAVKIEQAKKPGEPEIGVAPQEQAVKPEISLARVRPELTPSGDSSGLIVKLVETLEPPVPVPETWVLAVVALALTTALVVWFRKGR